MNCIRSVLLVVELLAVVTVILMYNVNFLGKLGEISPDSLMSPTPRQEKKENADLAIVLQRQLDKFLFPMQGEKNNQQCNISHYPLVFKRGAVSDVKYFKEKHSLHIIRPTPQEIKSYFAQNKTFSYANQLLQFGARNGLSGSRIWLNSKKNSQFSLPSNHIRRLKPLCMKITKKVTMAPQVLYESYKTSGLASGSQSSYLLIMHQGLVFDRGNVATSCGIFQQLNACVNAFYKQNIRKWTNLNKYLTKYQIEWAKLFKQHLGPRSLYQIQLLAGVVENATIEDRSARIPHLRRVLVVDSSWDYNYHHLLTESAPRLVRALPFLHSHPKVWIHMREEELLSTPVSAKKHQEGVCSRHGVLELLGLSPSRVVSGPVLSDYVLMPQDQGCSNFLEHPYELRALAGLLLQAAEEVQCENAVTATAVAPHVQKKKNIVVHNRPCSTDTAAYIWRCFTETSLNVLGAATREAFPEHNVFVHPRAQPSTNNRDSSSRSSSSSSSSESSSTCRDQMACDIQQARDTDIFIGLHGAAMTNVMFMRPGSLLVEVVGYFDGKMLPVCGIFGPLAALFGVHHYIYYYDGLYNKDKGEENGGDLSLGLNRSAGEFLLDMDLMMKNVRQYYDELY